MLDSLAATLHASELSRTLRGSLWLYPLVNTGHVFAIALLFGAITPLDLRLIGIWRSVPLEHAVRMLVPVALCGLLLAVSSGALLFATSPLDYIGEPLFLGKMLLLAAAVGNALLLRRPPQWGLAHIEAGTKTMGRWRVPALASLVLWLGVITAGRLIGYR